MRASGILLHITSLPSSDGVGTLGEVNRFIDFLKASGQKYWQILPVTPTDFVNSPYASPSAFAGNTLFVDLDELACTGLLSDETLSACKTCKGNDYLFAVHNKEIALREAYANFLRFNPPADYDDFCKNNDYWLADYALFCALKSYFGGKSWQEWDDDIRLRRPVALESYADKLSDEVDYYTFCQYVFYSQWAKFRQKIAAADIKLIGDIPIYVAYDSADVWAHPDLFELTADRRPSWVAGVPPDYFSADGQLWGNPLYDWDAMKKDGYDWWLRRVAKCAELFDVLRIDHFRAFDSYYAIKYGESTARHGHWKRGVGYEFLKTIADSVPQLTIIAEDLGDIPHSVQELRNRCGMAGMKVVQFAFDGNPKNAFLPQNFDEHCVAYLGTHDNDTTQGWWDSLDDGAKQRVLSTMGYADGEHIAHQLVRSLADSRAELVVYCMQDIAEDGTECRMNLPGTSGCWKYMAKRGDFCTANAKWLKAVTDEAKR